MHPKDADGMANSVDPDQTASSEAVWSWSALFAETYLSQYIEFVRYVIFSNATGVLLKNVRRFCPAKLLTFFSKKFSMLEDSANPWLMSYVRWKCLKQLLRSLQ